MKKYKGQKGLTLIELLVTVTVLIILAAAGVPSLRSFIQDNKGVTETNQLATAMNFARSEAVKRRLPVVVCAMNAAQDDCNSGSEPWDENGWMVFADRNNDGAYTNNGDATLAAGEDLLLKQWKDIKNKQDISVTAAVQDLAFLQTGELSSATAIGFVVDVADTSYDINRCVRVLRTGRVEYEKIEGSVTCP